MFTREIEMMFDCYSTTTISGTQLLLFLASTAWQNSTAGSTRNKSIPGCNRRVGAAVRGPLAAEPSRRRPRPAPPRLRRHLWAPVSAPLCACLSL